MDLLAVKSLKRLLGLMGLYGMTSVAGSQDNNVRILFIVSMCTLGNSREREVEVTVERDREPIRRGPYYYY